MIPFTSDDAKFHVDERKGLQRQFPPVFPRPLFAEARAWQIDSVAERAPWRTEIGPDEKITVARLAVHRAWQSATMTVGSKRGEFEATSVLRFGEPDEGEDPLRELLSAATRPREPLIYKPVRD